MFLHAKTKLDGVKLRRMNLVLMQEESYVTVQRQLLKAHLCSFSQL